MTRSYIDPPEPLREADQALARLRSCMASIGLVYLLGDRSLIAQELSRAITEAEQTLSGLRRAHAQVAP